ncbi:hypothetical protein G9A89_020795 [Geosiphon pyriformis]|nr:hypothetical protein G9A89_020795 [Geosiphon pyriformis]
MCNVRGMNNPTKQEDIFCWHKESGSLTSIVTETKLCSSSQPWIMKRFEGVQVFTSGLDVGFCGANMAIFVNNSLARYVSKVEKVKGRVLSICLLFKNKLSVSVIGFYACASGGDHFAQTSIINAFIANIVNKSSFVVLGEDFNKDNSVKGVSLRKCLGLGLVNVFSGHFLAKIPTWSNSRSVSKVLDYILISNSLISAVVDCDISSVSEFFNTDHLAVSMSIGLGGLLDAHLNSIHKHVNKDCWKFKIKDADEKKWACFKELSECAFLGSLDRFKMAEDGGNLDRMWEVLAEAMTASAKENFSRHWYSEFDCAKNRLSSKFSRLELLVAKLLKVLKLDDTLGFNCLADTWFKVDPSEASKVLGMVGDGVSSAGLISHLLKICYYDTIDKCMKKFDIDKVVLDHLVVGNSLILEPNEVKLKVDDIMVNWTRKWNALPVLSGPWAQQYVPLAYVNDGAFSLVMCDITMCEMSLVISNLPDGKAAGLSEIWMSMIPKPYDWNGILSNTWPIALIKMARKILSKVLSDRISLACSEFDVLHDNNFSVLKSTSTQLPISAVGSIVEDVLEKGYMCKTYDSISWPHLEASLCYIKMCGKFIEFFGNIHNNRFNRIITDFGLSDEYKVLDGLDQGEVFSPLLWRIFYDFLLCKVARQDHLCGYWINSNFVTKTGRIETSGGIMSFFVAGAFVDDTIWVENGQASTQHIFNVASEFFLINNININNEKMVAILINKRVGVPVLSINGQAIAVANPDLQTKCKIAFIVQFANSSEILGCLFEHQFLDLQILCWILLNPLQYPVRLRVNTSNNFLADKNGSVVSWHTFHQWKRLGSRGPVLLWFLKASTHLNSCLHAPPPASLASVCASVLDSTFFADICKEIYGLWADGIDVYTDSSLKGLGVEIHDVLSSTLAELQAVVLVLECVPASVLVALHTDSQAAIDTCVAKLGLLQLDCRNSCWIERHHVVDLIKSKDLTVHYIKVKSHAGIASNVMTDIFAEQAAHSRVSLPARINCRYVIANSKPVFGNVHHFVHDIFHSICKFQ